MSHFFQTFLQLYSKVNKTVLLFTLPTLWFITTLVPWTPTTSTQPSQKLPGEGQRGSCSAPQPLELGFVYVSAHCFFWGKKKKRLASHWADGFSAFLNYSLMSELIRAWSKSLQMGFGVLKVHLDYPWWRGRGHAFRERRRAWLLPLGSSESTEVPTSFIVQIATKPEYLCVSN